MIQFLISLVWSDPRRSITDPAGDVRNFIEHFEQKYVSVLNEDQTNVDLVPPPRMPPFFNGTYADALKEAKQTLRFLIVYLHGDSHEDTDVFCRDTLLDPTFLDFLTDNSLNVLFWGCNVNSPEGYRVSETFREHTYPFVGVVGLSNNPTYSSTSFGSPTRMALLGRIEGLTPATELINQLNLVMDDHQDVIVAERADRAERELSSRLRREQDEAFQASLEMDRARARLRAAAAETEERLAREAAEARKREALLARASVRRQRRWAASLPQEPSGDLDTVRHSIKLPDGTRAQRVFAVTDSLKHLYYFIISQEHAPKRFAVESNYPKKIIECRPGDESDIEEYIPNDENSDDTEPMPPREVKDWNPSSPSDPPSFKDANLAQPQMLFVLDLDS
nr:FAS associated factor 2 [Hymenolepis microstoma]